MSNELLTAITYTANTAVYATISIMMLCSNTVHIAQGKNDSFSKAKIYYGISSLIEAFVSCMILTRICLGIDYLPLNKFFVPLFFYFGLCFDMTVILLLLHSPRLNHRTILTFVTPVCAVWLVHIITYISTQHTFSLSPRAYDTFLNSSFSDLSSTLLYAVIAVEAIVAFFYIIKQSIRFKSRIDNFFTGEKRKRSQWIIYLASSLTLYYMVYAANIGTFSLKIDMTIMALKTVFALVCTIAVVNCRTLFWAMKPAFDESLNMRRADNATETDIEHREIGYTMPEQPFFVNDEPTPDNFNPTQTPAERPSGRSIDDIVAQWATREDKPFLKESITIIQVAEEMELNVRLLSKYINNVKGKNFNTWINEMKVEEIKRLLAEKPQLSMAELAYEVGFTDSPAMSKVFKNIVGMPPSVYKQSLKQKE